MKFTLLVREITEFAIVIDVDKERDVGPIERRIGRYLEKNPSVKREPVSQDWEVYEVLEGDHPDADAPTTNPWRD